MAVDEPTQATVCRNRADSLCATSDSGIWQGALAYDIVDVCWQESASLVELEPFTIELFLSPESGLLA